jgi:hypothetical protein
MRLIPLINCRVGQHHARCRFSQLEDPRLPFYLNAMLWTANLSAGIKQKVKAAAATIRQTW